MVPAALIVDPDQANTKYFSLSGDSYTNLFDTQSCCMNTLDHDSESTLLAYNPVMRTQYPGNVRLLPDNGIVNLLIFNRIIAGWRKCWRVIFIHTLCRADGYLIANYGGTSVLSCNRQYRLYLVKYLPGLLMMLYALWVTPAYALNREVPGCGNLANAYGPYDYTDPDDILNRLPIVERAHFTNSVETLAKGHTGTVMGDLDYTLRAFPNHHRALMSLIYYRLRHPWLPGQPYKSAECYFQRALAFKPDDGNVYMIYGIYQYKRGKYTEAEKLYRKALEIMPENADLLNNIALLYLKRSKYALAKKYAQHAYNNGFPLHGVEKKLRQIGEW